jgi:hypothetical protein
MALLASYTTAQLTTLCSTPAGLTALFQLLLAGNTVDKTSAAVTTPLAVITSIVPASAVP